MATNHEEVIETSEVEYEVEAVIGFRCRTKTTIVDSRIVLTHTHREYLVKWATGETTWEPRSNLTNCKESVYDFWLAAGRQGGLAGPTDEVEWD